MNNTRLLFVHALSSLHAGTGQGVGVIDLPIAREKATGLPFLPGSSVKGTLRSNCPEKYRTTLFGLDLTQVESNDNHASSVQVTDQRLLLLPIRSISGTFAWVTSPYVLSRFLRDIKDVQVKHAPPLKIPTIKDTQHCLVADTKTITMNKDRQPMVYLEDVDLIAEKAGEVEEWARWIGKHVFSDDTYWQERLIERFCVVHDDVFNFMITTATEITARIKMEEASKTVTSGGLWYEEALPAETILSGILLATPTRAAKIESKEVFEELEKMTTNKTMQFGGKATIGRGMCRVQLVQEEN